MRWLSLDLSGKRSGFAAWRKHRLVVAGVVYRHTTRKTVTEQWAVEEWQPAKELGEEPICTLKTFKSEQDSWEYVCKTYSPKMLLTEDTVGNFQSANIALSELRGYVARAAGLDRKKDVTKIVSNTWRKETKHLIIKTDKWGPGKWPGKSLNKEVAVDIAYNQFGVEVPHDCADAICIGIAYLGTSERE